MPPMAAGLFGYMSYDMVRLMEKLPDANPDMLGVPDGLFLRPTVIAVFDTIEDLVTVVTPVRPRHGLSAAAAYAAAQRGLEEVVGDFERPLAHPTAESTELKLPIPAPNMPAEALPVM